jgi:hypothetical protein
MDGLEKPSVSETPKIEALSNQEVLAFCDPMLDAKLQAELTELLAQNREGKLDERRQGRLEELIAAYRRGWVLKARAWKEAVARGLRPPLGTDAP